MVVRGIDPRMKSFASGDVVTVGGFLLGLDEIVERELVDVDETGVVLIFRGDPIFRGEPMLRGPPIFTCEPLLRGEARFRGDNFRSPNLGVDNFEEVFGAGD